MTIIRPPQPHNEMHCDAEGCKAKRKVYDGCQWKGWSMRVIGRPVSKDGSGGYRECHFCPTHTKAMKVKTLLLKRNDCMHPE